MQLKNDHLQRIDNPIWIRVIYKLIYNEVINNLLLFTIVGTQWYQVIVSYITRYNNIVSQQSMFELSGANMENIFNQVKSMNSHQNLKS